MKVRGTPLQPNPGRDDVHIRTRMEPGLATPTIIGDPVTRQDVAKETGEMRRFYMLSSNVKEIAKKIGYTDGCVGCRAVERGLVSKPAHSEECRRRMEPEIRKTARGAIRMEEYEQRIAKEVEEQVKRHAGEGDQTDVGNNPSGSGSGSSGLADRVRHENKLAKTQSAHEDFITSSNQTSTPSLAADISRSLDVAVVTMCEVA